MLLTESTFLFIFLPIFIVLHVAVTGRDNRDWLRDVVPLKALNVLLLAGSVVYFALLSPLLGSVLVAGTLFTYGVALPSPGPGRADYGLASASSACSSCWCSLRYDNAIGPNVGVLSLPLNGQPAGPWGLVAVVLSFFALQAVAYLVEAYRKPHADRPRSDPGGAVAPVLSVPAGRSDRPAQARCRSN